MTWLRDSRRSEAESSTSAGERGAASTQTSVLLLPFLSSLHLTVVIWFIDNSTISLPSLLYSSLRNLTNLVLHVSVVQSFTWSLNVSLTCSKPCPRPPCPHLKLSSPCIPISASHALFVPSSRLDYFNVQEQNLKNCFKLSEMVLNIEINACTVMVTLAVESIILDYLKESLITEYFVKKIPSPLRKVLTFS